MKSKHIIKVGPAGWSYKDWEGMVYPPKPPTRFDPLNYLAQFFDTIEINSTFYRPPTVSTAKSWAQRVNKNRHFSFTAKLNRVFTHERGQATREDEALFREAMDELAKANKLGAVLLQFPWSFKNDAAERIYLGKLLEQFKDYPLVLEVRHSSWNNLSIYEWLGERGVGICNIDQPLFSKSIRPASLTTSSIGYIRLHGRNYQNWFREKAPRDERYNYLYSFDELEPWVARIKEVAAATSESYVITNNHFRGQAVVNALEIKAILEEQAVAAPTTLVEKYPQLKGSVITSLAGDEGSPKLF
jgi:uncharacterized protein YecE (DUF72 family)